MAKREPNRATRFLSTRALRVQPDGRLVALTRGGYDSAFDEIVRRYGRPLRNYAASIATAQRADDVTQDAFTKAFLALRDTDKEIKLRPWLFRIVRNTALSDIRAEAHRTSIDAEAAIDEGSSPEEIAERREQISHLMAGLRELPEPQRAAIVMRELEGLSHEQIAASLGLSGGAVRQQIYRARRALREGFGLLVPLPALRLLLDHNFAQTATAASAAGGGGMALKLGLTALLAAGTVTTGAALKGDLKPFAKASEPPSRVAGDRGSDSGEGSGSSGRSGHDDRSGPGGGGHSGPGGGGGDRSGPGGGGDGRGGGGSGSDSSGPGSGSSGSGSGSGSSGSGSGGLSDPLDSSGPG